MPVQPGPEPQFELLPHTPERLAIGQRTQESMQQAPQFSLTALVDAEPLVAARAALKTQSADPLPTYNDFLLKAVAEVIGAHRRFNSWYTPEGLKLLKPVNLGFAVATEAGVLMPTVFDADRKSLAELAADTHELVELARAGRLRASLQRHAGFSLSNIGPSRVDWFNAIVAQPQPAILAVGSLKPRPLVQDGQLVVRATLYLTLTVDHRCADGAEGAAFLGDLAARLESAGEW